MTLDPCCGSELVYSSKSCVDRVLLFRTESIQCCAELFGVGFTLFTLVLWVGSYIFRVATKDMTYVSFVISSEREGMKHKE